MISKSNYAITLLYRTLVREILSCPLDKVTNRRLLKYAHKRFSRDVTDLGLLNKRPLYAQLKEAKIFLSTLKGASRDRNPDLIKDLLSLSYIHLPSLKSRCPLWLNDFLLCKSIGKCEKKAILQKYGGMLRIRHLMDKFSLDDQMKKKYHDYFAKKMANSTPNSEPVELILNDKKHPLTTESLQGKLTHDVRLLVKFRNEFDKAIKTKLKLPPLTINLMPTRFGEPLPKVRLINIMVKRLTDIQNFYLHYSPISASDMIYLDNLSSSGFFEGQKDVLQGYMLFTEDCYFVTEDANIVTSQMSEHIYNMPAKLNALYKQLLDVY